MQNLLLFMAFLVIQSCSGPSGQSARTENSQQPKSNFTQTEMLAMLAPLLRSEGIIYQKYQNIFAQKTTAGTQIQTVTSDGLETTNTAKEGDFIVRNKTNAGEMYIMGAEKFHARYELLKEGTDGFDEYRPIGRIFALEMTAARMKQLNLPNEFNFTAAWGSDMVVKKDDFLASPLDYSEVYRIARKEFFETYKEVKEMK